MLKKNQKMKFKNCKMNLKKNKKIKMKLIEKIKE